MHSSLIAGTVFACSVWNGSAQVTRPTTAATQACLEFNRSVVSQIQERRLTEAEIALSKALASREDLLDEPCAWLLLQNAANIAEVQGRFLAAEQFARQCLRIVDRLFPESDARRLPSLHLLWSLQSQSGARAQARGTFAAMVQLRLDKLQDRALLHGAAAQELQLEGRMAEAEVEYRGALSAGEEAGLGETANQAIVLSALGSLYLAQNRLHDAEVTLSQAFALVHSARDAVPSDYINVIQARAALRTRQKQWTAAEEDLRWVVALADRARLDPVQMRALLESHSYVLRKAHRPAEARAIESRAATIHDVPPTNGVVDITELRTGHGAKKRR